MKRADPAARPALRDMHRHTRAAESLLKAMANEQRLLILCHLAAGELSVGEINKRVDLSQSSLSQHLATLRRDELVDTRRAAQTIYYRLADGPAAAIMETLYEHFCAPDAGGES